MDETLALLAQTPLFSGLRGDEIAALLACAHPLRRRCGAGEVLLACGQESSCIGIVLAGGIEAVRPLPGGARMPITRMGPGGVFGDVLGGTGLKSPVTVTACGPTEVLLIPCAPLLAPCEACCPAHSRFLRNLAANVGRKYFALFGRMELLTLKSLRAKVGAFLLGEADAAGADTFTVPYTRGALAEYLGCERSALSREISRMQRDGLIETYKNSFRLLDRAALERLCRN
jgi:CRP-like cAMP-binding protein